MASGSAACCQVTPSDGVERAFHSDGGEVQPAARPAPPPRDGDDRGPVPQGSPPRIGPGWRVLIAILVALALFVIGLGLSWRGAGLRPSELFRCRLVSGLLGLSTLHGDPVLLQIMRSTTGMISGPRGDALTDEQVIRADRRTGDRRDVS